MECSGKSGLINKALCAAVALALAAAFSAPAAYAVSDEAAASGQAAVAGNVAAASAADGEVAVVFTNDVHCGVDDGLGYAGVAAFVEDAEGEFGLNNVTLVDAGDAVQGAPLGTLTEGEALVDIMNLVDYDIAVPGNHEFDYGMDRFFELVGWSDATYLSCNFTDLRTGATALSPYEIVTYDGVADAQGGTLEVAYVGISTPETLTKSSPVHFQDETGAYVYSFCEDETGEALYRAVQDAVDAARAEGADYVIAVGHLGQAGTTDRWTSSAVVGHTTGIDALIDGHSHQQYCETVANAQGEDVLVAQTGTKLAAVGELVIDPDADAAAGEKELEIAITEADGYAKRDAEVQSEIDRINDQFAEQLDRVVGTSEVDLLSEDYDTGLYVRYQETNLGDLVADAYRVCLGADVGLVNGGGVRASIAAGDVTYRDLLSVQPYSNELCLVEVTGQTILDALEMGVRFYPDPSGGFLQVSGVTFTVRTDIPSSVVTDDYGNFVSVDGAYRVCDVMVGGAPLDLAATYTVASHGYMLKEGGDGMTMFAGCPLLLDSVMLDNQALVEYVAEDLDGTIGAGYENAEGAGRIVFSDGADQPEPLPGDEDPGTVPTDPGADKPAAPSSSTGKPSGSALPQTSDSLSAVTAALAGVMCLSALAAFAAGIAVRRHAKAMRR